MPADREGSETASSGADHVVVSRHPATGEENGSVTEASPAAVDRAIADAHAAQPDWAARPIGDRLDVLRRFRALLLDRKTEIARTVADETGKPVGEAVGTEVSPVLSAVGYAIESGPGVLRERLATGSFAAVGTSELVREPRGVVGMITPWNYPFGIPGSEVVPIILAGNAVVLKPAEETTFTALRLRELLDEAGLPAALFTVVPGRGRTTGQALADGDIDFLSFTGSPEVGQALDAACTQRGVPTCLELGGSDPAIVLADADLDLAAAGIRWARFSNAGQSCAAVKRVYVEAPLAKDLTDRLVAGAEALRVGDGSDGPVDVGPLISTDAVEAVHDQVERAVSMGATVLTGGAPLDDCEGPFYPPTVLTDVTEEMPVVTEETFGPVLPVVPVPDAEAAIDRANDSRFGLTASVWTADTDRGRSIARRLEAGTVTVNEHLYTFGLHATPWGGVKDSGGEFSHGRWILEAVTRPKHVHVASGEPGLPRRPATDPWWFPYDAGYAERIGAVIDFLYGAGVAARLRAAPSVLRSILRG